MANKANASDLDGLLTSDALTATLEGYATTDALTSGLGTKLDADALEGYMTTSEVDTKISDATKNFLTSESETVANITEQITNVTNLINNEDTGLTSKIELKEDVSNKTQNIAENAGSETMYPSAKAVATYVANTVSEGVDVNTDQISDRKQNWMII